MGEYMRNSGVKDMFWYGVAIEGAKEGECECGYEGVNVCGSYCGISASLEDGWERYGSVFI